MAPDDGQASGAWRRPDALLEHYEAIADESRAMLAAARAADWAGVARSEQRCGELIARLRAAFDGTPLSDGDQRRRIALLRAILTDDAEISARTQPWVAQLDALLAPPARS